MRPSEDPRKAAAREILAAACELVDIDDGEAWKRLKAAVEAYRRLPKEQLGLEVGR